MTIIKKIREYIIEEKCQTVCDFACGDGAYIKQLASTGASFYGVDISETMLELAKKNLKDVNASVELEVSGSGISEDRMFDMIYSSAVWAHIDDSVLEKLVKNIYDHLKKNGLFIICEQTSPYRYGGGGGWIRRPCTDYLSVLKKIGFSVVKTERIDFWLHRIVMERHLVKWACNRKAFESNSSEQIRVNLNRNKLYRAISWVLTKLSVPKIFHQMDGWGYCFIVLRKPDFR